MHPFQIWNSPEVTDLLIRFFGSNFEYAGVDRDLGEKIVKTAWEKKGDITEEAIRLEINGLFDAAKNQIKSDRLKEPELLTRIINIGTPSTFLDIGANKLDILNKIARFIPETKELIAIDVVPQQNPFYNPKKSRYIQVDYNFSELPLEDDTIELINLRFVLHHFNNLKSIKNLLEECKRILKPNGELLFWEETFVKTLDVMNLITSNKAIGLMTDKDLTESFYKLPDDKKFEFIKVNDWLINTNNEHMQWSDQYYAWEEWVDLFSKYEFDLHKEFNLGLRINGKLKQGVHIIGLFKLQEVVL